MESCAIFTRCPGSVYHRADHPWIAPASRAAVTVVYWMLWLFAPEPSDLQSRKVAAFPPGWREMLKTFFWIGISIGGATLLARICR